VRGQLIEKNLQDIRVHPSDNQTEEFPAGRTHHPDDVLPNMIAQVRHRPRLARLRPAPPRPGIAFHTALIPEPQFDLWISGPFT
jgi:hypothetical protein